MNSEDLQIRISSTLPAATFETGTEWTTVNIEPASWLPLALQLRHDEDLHLDFLFCLTCVDWKSHLTMHYHLTSTTYRHTLVIRCRLDRVTPEIETVSHIWRTAEFHEREAYELFGVKFLHHPDLRRLVLTDDFDGWPLRKDFEDPINMIKL